MKIKQLAAGFLAAAVFLTGIPAVPAYAGTDRKVTWNQSNWAGNMWGYDTTNWAKPEVTTNDEGVVAPDWTKVGAIKKAKGITSFAGKNFSGVDSHIFLIKAEVDGNISGDSKFKVTGADEIGWTALSQALDQQNSNVITLALRLDDLMAKEKTARQYKVEFDWKDGDGTPDGIADETYTIDCSDALFELEDQEELTNGNWVVSANKELTNGLTVGEKATLTIAEEKTLTIPSGKKLIANGSVTNNGTIACTGEVDGKGEIKLSENGKFIVPNLAALKSALTAKVGKIEITDNITLNEALEVPASTAITIANDKKLETGTYTLTLENGASIEPQGLLDAEKGTITGAGVVKGTESNPTVSIGVGKSVKLQNFTGIIAQSVKVRDYDKKEDVDDTNKISVTVGSDAKTYTLGEISQTNNAGTSISLTEGQKIYIDTSKYDGYSQTGKSSDGKIFVLYESSATKAFANATDVLKDEDAKGILEAASNNGLKLKDLKYSGLDIFNGWTDTQTTTPAKTLDVDMSGAKNGVKLYTSNWTYAPDVVVGDPKDGKIQIATNTNGTYYYDIYEIKSSGSSGSSTQTLTPEQERDNLLQSFDYVKKNTRARDIKKNTIETINLPASVSTYKTWGIQVFVESSEESFKDNKVGVGVNQSGATEGGSGEEGGNSGSGGGTINPGDGTSGGGATPTPTAEPTATPTATPTAEPTATPTATPTQEPLPTPAPDPAADVDPSANPSDGKVADGEAKVTEEGGVKTTEQANTDGSTTVTVEDSNTGTTTVTVTEPDKTVTTQTTSTNGSTGYKTESVRTEQANGDFVEKTRETSPTGVVTETTASQTTETDGSKTTTEGTKAADGSATEKETNTKTNGDFTQKYFEMDTTGKVTLTEESSKTTAADNSTTETKKTQTTAATTEETVAKDASGAVKTVTTKTTVGNVTEQASFEGTTGNSLVLSSMSTSGTTLVIPEKVDGITAGESFPVTAIADSAFENAALNSVTLPDSVDKIGKKAFAGCGITELKVEGTVTKGMFAKNALKDNGTGKKGKGLTITVDSKKAQKALKKQLKKAGAAKATVKIAK